MTQFVNCAFTEGGRAYAYANNGEPLTIGDRVEVESRGGIATVEVVSLLTEEPAFACKPVLGPALPRGLFRHNGKVSFSCRVCGNITECPVEPAEFDPDGPGAVCGGSPRCCP